MIKWLRAKTNPVPSNYDCLFVLENGDMRLGRPEEGMIVVAWSVANRPEWINHEHTGKVSGELHPKAFLSDADCELMRKLHESGGVSYRMLAEKFNCSRSTARDIVTYRRRFKGPLGCTHDN